MSGGQPCRSVIGTLTVFFVELKADPGQLELAALLDEMTKLAHVKAIGLRADLFTGYSERLVAAWRARAAAS